MNKPTSEITKKPAAQKTSGESDIFDPSFPQYNVELYHGRQKSRSTYRARANFSIIAFSPNEKVIASISKNHFPKTDTIFGTAEEDVVIENEPNLKPINLQCDSELPMGILPITQLTYVLVVELSEIDDIISQIAHSAAQGDSSPTEITSSGLSRLLSEKNAAENEPNGGKGKTSNLMSLWKATENEGSVLKRLINLVGQKPKPEQGSSETFTAPLDKVSVSTPMEPPPAVSTLPARRVEQTPDRDGSPMLPATQSQCDPSYLEQPDSTFLAHSQGPSPMIVVPDSPYLHRRQRPAKAAESSKPEPEWHGMKLDDQSTSQHAVLENMPSPDELRQLTTGKQRVLEEPSPPVPVQSKVSRMMPEPTFSERAKAYFAELAVTIKNLFTSQP